MMTRSSQNGFKWETLAFSILKKTSWLICPIMRVSPHSVWKRHGPLHHSTGLMAMMLIRWCTLQSDRSELNRPVYIGWTWVESRRVCNRRHTSRSRISRQKWEKKTRPSCVCRWPLPNYCAAWRTTKLDKANVSSSFLNVFYSYHSSSSIFLLLLCFLFLLLLFHNSSPL